VKSSYHGKSTESDGYDDLDVKNRGNKRWPDPNASTYDEAHIDVSVGIPDDEDTLHNTEYNASSSKHRARSGSPKVQSRAAPVSASATPAVTNNKPPAISLSLDAPDAKVEDKDSMGISARKNNKGNAQNSPVREQSTVATQDKALKRSTKGENDSDYDDEFNYEERGTQPFQPNDGKKSASKMKNNRIDFSPNSISYHSTGEDRKSGSGVGSGAGAGDATSRALSTGSPDTFKGKKSEVSQAPMVLTVADKCVSKQPPVKTSANHQPLKVLSESQEEFISQRTEGHLPHNRVNQSEMISKIDQSSRDHSMGPLSGSDWIDAKQDSSHTNILQPRPVSTVDSSTAKLF